MAPVIRVTAGDELQGELTVPVAALCTGSVATGPRYRLLMLWPDGRPRRVISEPMGSVEEVMGRIVDLRRRCRFGRN